MGTEEEDFIANTLRICQDIQNRFYSERVKVGDIDPDEPWWLIKVSLVARNADLYLRNKASDVEWHSDFGEPTSF